MKAMGGRGRIVPDTNLALVFSVWRRVTIEWPVSCAEPALSGPQKHFMSIDNGANVSSLRHFLTIWYEAISYSYLLQ